MHFRCTHRDRYLAKSMLKSTFGHAHVFIRQRFYFFRIIRKLEDI